MQVGLFGLQRHGRCLDGDLFGHRAHFQLGVAVTDGVGRYGQICLREGLEAASCDLEVVLAWRYVCDCVMTGVVRVRFALKASAMVGDNYMCLRHTRAALVRHRTRY